MLHRERVICISEKTDRGERIEVRLAHHSVSATANFADEWSVRLPAMHAGSSYTLTFDETIDHSVYSGTASE